MSPVAIRTFRTINTKLDLNGPILSFSEQPTSVTSSIVGDTKTFTATAVATFPAGQTSRNTDTGTITYQWYTKPTGIDVTWTSVSNETRTNDNSTTTVISGATTNTLSIASVQYAEDREQEYKVRATYNASAYGSGNLSPNAWNSPLDSNSASLSVTPVLSIVTQPADATGTTETQTQFVVSGTSDDANLIATITYQWQMQTNSSGSWSDIANSDVISGATSNRLNIRTIEGTHKVRCIVSHTISEPSPITSDEATFTVENPRLVLMRQDVDGGGRNPLTDEYFAPQVSSYGVRNINSNSIYYDGALHITGTSLRKEKNVDQWLKGSPMVFVWAPEQDLDVMVEMAGAGGERVKDFGGVQAGQGGWGVFRMTMKQNQEYTFKIGCGGDKSQGDGWGPRGGGISGDLSDGAPGGGGCYMYEGNQLIAVVGGGGGAGRSGAGGDGSQFGGRGQNGFGRYFGQGGAADPPGSRNSRFHPHRDGGSAAGCPNSSLNRIQALNNEKMNVVGGDCGYYTLDGPFVDNAGAQVFDGTFQRAPEADEDVLVPETANLKRGFRTGDGGRWSGGWGISGNGGGGGAGSRGGYGSQNNGYGGGGGSSWTSQTVLGTVAGGHGGDAYAKIMIYDPDNIPSGPTPPAPPTFSSVNWDDPRAPGCRWGGSGEYYHNQSNPSERGIKGPTGSVGNNSDWLGSFSESANFNKCGTNSDNISYIKFELHIYSLGPRTTKSDSFDPSGGDHRDDGQYSTQYLTNNRGNRDPNIGRTRKWLASGRDQNKRQNWINSGSTGNSERNSGYEDRNRKYTASVHEAFVPFKLEFTLRFSFATEPQTNTYRVMDYTKIMEWNNWGEYKQVSFNSAELARANGLPESGGKLYLPDAGINHDQANRRDGYSGPRIEYIRSRLINQDTGREGGINPFWMAYDPGITGDEGKPYSHNFVEFGRSVFR